MAEKSQEHLPAGRHREVASAMPSASSGNLPPAVKDTSPRRHLFGRMFAIREAAPIWQVLLFSLLCIVVVGGVWWYLTKGEPEERILSYSVLPSPAETFAKFPSLWFDRALTRNTFVTLKRLTLGFGLAVVVGIPLGVLAGCFSRIRAFLLPVTLFGRNIPVAALIPLTLSLFGIGEQQKIMFIFIACVAFIISDTANAIQEIGSQYIDTAYTLGASRWQVVMKVLIPLAMPNVLDSLRLLFGLAFGYIMLAEVIKFGTESGGLGDIINISQRLGQREHVLLVLLIIPIVALAIDRLLFWVQRELFPHRFGGTGILNQALRATMHVYEDVKNLIFRRGQTAVTATPNAAHSAGQKPHE